MNDFFVFRTVSGLYDVPLDEPRPQFCQKRRKKNSSFANSAYFLRPSRAYSESGWNFYGTLSKDGDAALNRRRSPCHALSCGPAHLQPFALAFSPPAPHVIRRLAMRHRRDKFSDTSSGRRSTSATFILFPLLEHLSDLLEHRC